MSSWLPISRRGQSYSVSSALRGSRARRIRWVGHRRQIGKQIYIGAWNIQTGLIYGQRPAVETPLQSESSPVMYRHPRNIQIKLQLNAATELRDIGGRFRWLRRGFITYLCVTVPLLHVCLLNIGQTDRQTVAVEGLFGAQVRVTPRDVNITSQPATSTDSGSGGVASLSHFIELCAIGEINLSGLINSSWINPVTNSFHYCPPTPARLSNAAI